MDEFLEWFFSTFSSDYKYNVSTYRKWKYLYYDVNPLDLFNDLKVEFLKDSPPHLRDSYKNILDWYGTCTFFEEHDAPSFKTGMDTLDNRSDMMSDAIPFLQKGNASIYDFFKAFRKATEACELFLPPPVEEPFLVLGGVVDETMFRDIFDVFLSYLFSNYTNEVDNLFDWGTNKVGWKMIKSYDLDSLANALSITSPTLHSLANSLVNVYYKESSPNKRATADDDRELLFTILKGTGIPELFKEFPGKPAIPSRYRFQHQHILAPTGSGKTTLLTMQLQKDLEAVKRGECSVIVMDTKRNFIKSIEKLRGLEGKVVSIDVEDSVEGNPIALNILDLGGKGFDFKSKTEKAISKNSTISLLNYFFTGLLSDGAELTERQQTIFRHIISLCIEIPNANIDTVIEILEPDNSGLKKYRNYIENLNNESQRFFDKRINTQEFSKRRGEILARIEGIMSRESLADLFKATETKLNLFSELNEGKVILINCARSVLRDDVEIFGRFMLAMIFYAVEQRQFIPEKDRKPVYMVMDEAGDIIGRDTQLPDMLRLVREYKLAMTFSHQSWSDIDNPKVRAGLVENTIIKMMPNQADYTFNVECGQIHGTLKTEDVSFSRLPPMSVTEYQSFLNENRQRYCMSPDDFVTPEPLLKVAEPDVVYEAKTTTKAPVKSVQDVSECEPPDDDGTDLNF